MSFSRTRFLLPVLSFLAIVMPIGNRVAFAADPHCSSVANSGGCMPYEACANNPAAGGTSPADDCPTGSICCVLKPPASQSGTTPAAQSGVGVVSLKLPACVTDKTKNGNCTLDDIVTTGASFANLLTSLSAAAFFATFIYGGAMYLLSFGDKSRVDKGKKALTGAAIGMFIVLIAWTLVNYVANSLLGKA